MASLEHDPASDADAQSTVPVQAQQDNKYFEVPLDSNKNYIERPSITSQLEDLLKPPKSNAASRAVRVVLYGLGGAGKTELAVRFAERHRRRYKAVFWVYGTDVSRLKEGFERIGKTVDRNNNGPHRDLVLDAQAWFADNGDWLLIVDNVDEEDALNTLRWQYLKGGMNGHIIVTSRNPSTSVYWNGIEVADMNQSEAIDLVINITGRQSEAEDTNLSRLLGDLGQLPLAIDQASSYMAATGMSINEYHRWFKIKKARLLKEVPSTHYHYDSRQTVMTTWEISFQRVEQSNLAASQLLLMMSIFSHDDIPITMLQLKYDSLRYWASNGEWEALPEDQEWVQSRLKSTLYDGLRLRDAIRSLRKFSFIRYKPGGDSFWLHPLVHYWASHKMKSHPDQQKLTMCSIGLVASSFKKEDRLPPIATPYGKRDVASVGEEKTLRLWPWRQYLNLIPHAHRCLQHVTSLTSMPEAMAHLCLSLLQVLEYISTADDPVVVERLAVENAHAVIDHAERFGESPDEYHRYSATLWRLTRAAVCNCQKHAAVMSKRCRRCQQATQGAVQLIKDVIVQPAGTNRTPRIKATILGLLFVIFLDYGQLLDVFQIPDFRTKFDPFRAVWNWDIKTVEYDSLFNGIAFFCNMSQSASLLERYVYNMGGYLLVRFAVEERRLSSIYSTPAERVTKVFEALSGQESEEYRRSIWYLTTYLEEQGAWTKVREYLEPLVVQSMNEPTLVWSHERCIIRLIHAYFELDLSSEAQQLSERVQKSYDCAGKVLRSMQKGRLPAEDKALQVFRRPYFAPFHKLM